MSQSKGFTALMGRALRETGAALKLGGNAEVGDDLVLAEPQCMPSERLLLSSFMFCSPQFLCYLSVGTIRFLCVIDHA